MKKILALAGSNSLNSINKAFLRYVSQHLEGQSVDLLDMNDFQLPLYSPDLEKSEGIPGDAQKFSEVISDADGIILAMAEYNGLHATAFKNLWDWASRIDQKIWKNKPMLLMAASPGGRGGANVLSVTKNLMPHFGGHVVAEFSLPSFHKNFQEGQLVNEELADSLKGQVSLFLNALS